MIKLRKWKGDGFPISSLTCCSSCLGVGSTATVAYGEDILVFCMLQRALIHVHESCLVHQLLALSQLIRRTHGRHSMQKRILQVILKEYMH